MDSACCSYALARCNISDVDRCATSNFPQIRPLFRRDVGLLPSQAFIYQGGAVFPTTELGFQRYPIGIGCRKECSFIVYVVQSM